MLVASYIQSKNSGKPFEIIFCSGDHDKNEFQGYYESMPWLAIDYDDEKREDLMSKFRVTGIPKLSILASNGQILVDNAAGQAISEELIDSWIERARL